MRRLGVPALVAALAGPAAGHPHSQTDQQAALTLFTDRIELRLVIVPSPEEAPTLIAHLDRDGDGTVSQTEAERFGAALLAGVVLTVGDTPQALRPTTAVSPTADELRSGLAAFSVTGSADVAVNLAPAVSVEIRRAGLSDTWFIQPYYHPTLHAQVPHATILRPADDNAVTVNLRPAK